MKILHCCLSGCYNDNYNYQENFLSRQNKIDGHEVMIIASTEVFKDNNRLGYCEPEEYVNADGIKVIRVPYRNIINKKISSKIRAYKGVYPLIEKFEPDVILFHGIGAWELKTVCKYVKKNPRTKLYVDTHAAYTNSGTNFVSKQLLHKIFYRSIIKKALRYTKKILCIGAMEKKFAHEIYDIPEDCLELYPLGGKIIDDAEYEQIRIEERKKLGLTDKDILFVHSGKFVRGNMDNDNISDDTEVQELSKYHCGKRTCELLRAFEAVANDKFKLVIAGNFSPDLQEEAKELIGKDSRVDYVGWKSGDELIRILCAADVYLQPGTPSATLQNSMCLRCAVMVRPYSTYKYILGDEAWYVSNEEDIKDVFREISQDDNIVEIKRAGTYNRAINLLDYKVLASRLYV